MPRILAIDYGTKKTGLAVTDPLQIIAQPLETVPTVGLWDYLTDYLGREQVECIVVGEPLHMDGSPAQIHHLVVGLERKLKRTYPDIEVVLQDERMTTREARDIVLQSVSSRKRRRDKTLLDKVSATLILQAYMNENRW